MSRKRIGIDLILLVLALGIGLWGWRANVRRLEARRTGAEPEAAPTPRMTDFMRRTAHSNDIPQPVPTLPPTPVPVITDPVEEIEEPVVLGLTVTTPDGNPHPGPIEIFSPDTGFSQWIPDHRLALRIGPGPQRFQAAFTDEYGTRESQIQEIDAVPGEAYALTLVIPFPEPASPGFTLIPGDGFAEVVEVFPGSPAANAGMVPGDAVLTIDQIDVDGLEVQTLNNLLLGPPGQPVRLLMIIRNDAGDLEEVEVELPRGD